MTDFVNQRAKDFSLQDQDGNTHTLQEYVGKFLLLFFYPKDMTPGCTLEACGFRDVMNDLADAGVQVVGVSADDVKAHKKFAIKHQLHFPLLADTERELIDHYDLWKEKSMFGKTFMGVKRESFLINPDGVVVKHYVQVDPKKHPAEVLHDIAELKKL